MKRELNLGRVTGGSTVYHFEVDYIISRAESYQTHHLYSMNISRWLVNTMNFRGLF